MFPFLLETIHSWDTGKSATTGMQPADIASSTLTDVPSLVGMEM
jgi:hypothetical protein